MTDTFIRNCAVAAAGVVSGSDRAISCLEMLAQSNHPADFFHQVGDKLWRKYRDRHLAERVMNALAAIFLMLGKAADFHPALTDNKLADLYEFIATRALHMIWKPSAS